MSAIPVVEDLDPLKYFSDCLFSCFKFLPINAFSFQRMEKTFNRSVVPAISLTTHTAKHFVSLEQSLIISTCVLTPPI